MARMGFFRPLPFVRQVSHSSAGFNQVLNALGVTKFNDDLREQNASLVKIIDELRQEIEKRNHDHEAFLVSTQTLIEDRNKLQERVEELEAISQRLVDMLWGRRSERRVDDPHQQSLDFGEAPSDEQPDAIMAQLQADEALDKQIVLKGAVRRRQ